MMGSIRKNVLYFGVFMIGMLLVNSCVRERDTNTDQALDEILGEFAFYDAVSIADDAATKKTGELLSNYKTTGYCATITHDEVSMPRTLVIDFGAVNCMCNDGRNRRGKIVVSYTGNKYSDSNSIAQFNFDKYFIDNSQIMGSTSVTNMGRNVNDKYYFEIKTEGKILREFILDTVYWNADRVRTWIQGQDTPIWTDDYYEINGTGNGRSNQLGYYSCNIVSPLLKGYDCRFFTKGRVEMQPQGKTLRTIDMGEGSCDWESWVEIDRKRYYIRQY